MPSLQTLDGIDFSKDEVMIAEIRAQTEQEKREMMANGGLSSVAEEAKGQTMGGAASGGN